MSYTWGYIKDVALAKLDLTEDEANTQNLLSRFPFYANEAMTQICSSVKPKYTFAKFVIDKDQVGQLQDMPLDFVSFGDDVCYQIKMVEDFIPSLPDNDRFTDWHAAKIELHDDDFEYSGNSQVIFKHPGEFYISYNARWFTFSKSIDNNIVVSAPNDVLDCIPSYIASQCYKIDDEYKSSVFRNEYEMFLARIDNTNFKSNKTFIIEGGW